MDKNEKKGYLDHDFRMFHLKEEGPLEVASHYHDFDKVLLFLGGNAAYSIEGRRYELRPFDIVLVNAGQLHRPIVQEGSPYERIIIYISTGFLAGYRTDSCDLRFCFQEAQKRRGNVLRMENLEKSSLYYGIRRLEQSFQEQDYGQELYQRVLFLEFMILLNRALLHNRVNYLENRVSNQKIASIIDYINDHLSEEITVDGLAERFFLSRSHLMHLFKAETDYSVGAYINEKRLLLSKSLIQNGMPATEACYESGFRDYSTFCRAFRKKYQTTPRNAGKLL
ncbi:MAG TPA: AraC family transcriptional regulator [Candidatus Eisenbergiella intestinipullorum]|nr:AraC family transcriptional regulator [Candidatus Eisenbergiella intestinipullorum]